MGVADLAKISIVTDDATLVVSGGSVAEWDAIRLDQDPDGMFDTEIDLKTISTAGAPGGRAGVEEVPVRELTLPFNIYATPTESIEQVVSRFRRLLWRKDFQWHYDTVESGLRWLKCRRSKGIKVNPKQDWNLHGYASAKVEAVALNPFYESAPHTVNATNTTAGVNTFWLPVWNPTDQDAWPEWALKPNGTATFSFADFSFGHEQEIDVTWTPGMHANRMVITPPISVMWSVMSHPLMDPYVAADLSNAPGQMLGVEPLYRIPPYTGTEADPVLLPVTIDGPVGAQVKLTLRRFWSAEMGMGQ